MKSGKLESKELEDIVFRNLTFRRPEVLVRSGIGEDCAVVDFGEYNCVLSTDPITGAVNKIGKLAVAISCNDIATKGIQPLGILLACLFPEKTTLEEIEEVMKQAGEEGQRLGVEIIGGHTEITAAVNQPVIVSTAIGKEVSGAEKPPVAEGDRILLTKTAGLEGTGILALDHADSLRSILDPQELQEAQWMLDQVAVVREGVIAGKRGASAMHDVTEGGVLGAVWELSHANGFGATIWEEKLPVAPVTEKIASLFQIDWKRLISSGSMLIVAGGDAAQQILDELTKEGIEAVEIGRITGPLDPVILKGSAGSSLIDPPGRDELYKAVLAVDVDPSRLV